MFAVPTLDGNVNFSIAAAFARMAAQTGQPGTPLQFMPFIVAGISPIQYCRNKIVESFLKTDCHWLMMVDADQIVPENFWELLRIQADIVSGKTYVWVGNEYKPGRLRLNQYSLDENNQCFNVAPPADWPDTQAYPVPVVGTGCIAIRRRVLEKLGPVFKFTYLDNGKVLAGEDVNFCCSAQVAGFTIAVNPAVKFGHMKTIDLAQIEEFHMADHDRLLTGKPHTPHDMLSISA